MKKRTKNNIASVTKYVTCSIWKRNDSQYDMLPVDFGMVLITQMIQKFWNGIITQECMWSVSIIKQVSAQQFFFSSSSSSWSHYNPDFYFWKHDLLYSWHPKWPIACFNFAGICNRTSHGVGTIIYRRPYRRPFDWVWESKKTYKSNKSSIELLLTCFLTPVCKAKGPF